MEIWLPYGRTEIPVKVPDENLLGIITPNEKQGVADPKAEIIRALENPIKSKRLIEIAKPGNKAAIVIDDVTRPSPSYLMIPPILDELNRAGVKDEDITILIGCGTHRLATPEEAAKLVGEDVYRRIKVVSHDCKSAEIVCAIGETKFKTKVCVNKIFFDADVKILVGDIELHYYAGYGGGRKGVVPAIGSLDTIQHNHSMLLDPKATVGILEGNPVHEDMTESARLAKVDFILNVVLNTRKEIVGAFAGDLEQAFLDGVKVVDEMYKVHVEQPAEIVITSADGDPHDIDLYQALKAVENAKCIVKEGGVIILVAECREGYGNQVFYDWMTRLKNLEDVEKEVKRNFMLGGHKAYYLLKTLEKAKIILVSTMPDYYATGVFKLKTSKTVNAALNTAFNIVGKKSKIYVVPNGSTTLPLLKN
ncbi:MAG TPA: nickel-dependent lactate racemase [archaeon]|nr:nickel-dependent lactate racemase [archaeon]